MQMASFLDSAAGKRLHEDTEFVEVFFILFGCCLNFFLGRVVSILWTKQSRAHATKEGQSSR